MAIEISPTPKIPMSLRVAAERRKLVVFVGAGVSRLAGAPNWNQFADAILNRLVELGKLTYAEIEQIRVQL